jgi:hypothetical protein
LNPEEARRICSPILEKEGPEAVLRWLRQAGATPIQSIRTLTELGLSLAEAKRTLHFSATWSDIRDSSEKLQEEAERAARELEQETSSDWP